MFSFIFFFFFFSSRRRHTRYWRDWSSDVCSSDLDDAATRRALPRRKRTAGEKAAAAERGEEDVEVADLVDQLEGRRALAGDDIRVVVGWDERQAALGGELRPEHVAVVLVAVEVHDLRGVAARRRDLHRRRVLRHQHRDGHALELPRVGERLTVIAGREGENAALAGGAVEVRYSVAGAAELEGACPLQVLGLEEHVRARA